MSIISVRAWLDTESNGFNGRLVSIALICEDNTEFYEVVPCDFPEKWVSENVIPKLLKPSISVLELRFRLCEFIRKTAINHIVADWPRDFYLFSELLLCGPNYMGPQRLTMEIRRDLICAGNEQDRHNALNDARALKNSHLLEEEYGG